MNIDPVHLAYRSTTEGAQKILTELEVELAEVEARRNRILADISKANDGDRRQLATLSSLNKRDAETSRLVRSIEAQVAEARKRISMADAQAAAAVLKREQSDSATVFGDRLFEVETPDGRRVRHRYASPDGLQKILQPNYRVVAEVFAAGVDGKGGMVEPLGHSTMKTFSSVHGDELIAFLSERGIKAA
jgi:chromosome segregation ATPase